jgi:hypothetical protein
MVVSLNLPPFNAIFGFAKGKKPHGAKSGELGGCGTRVVLFLARDYEE